MGEVTVNLFQSPREIKMADTISLMYRPKNMRFTNVEQSFLNSYFRQLHSMTMREFTSDMRVLFQNIRETAVGGAPMFYEAAHIVDTEKQRFRCKEVYTNRNGENPISNLLEFTLNPTDIVERDKILEFHQHHGAPTGCDELEALLTTYCNDHGEKKKVFDGNIDCVNALTCLVEFLHFWRGRTSLFKFEHIVTEEGSLQLSAIVTVRNTAAYCFHIDVVIN